MIVKRLFVTAAFVWLNAIAVANASFLDNAITAEWVFPDFSSTIETHDVLVGPGVELPSSAIEGSWPPLEL